MTDGIALAFGFCVFFFFFHAQDGRGVGWRGISNLLLLRRMMPLAAEFGAPGIWWYFVDTLEMVCVAGKRALPSTTVIDFSLIASIASLWKIVIGLI
jgi:hypothetical protein